jgi:hypothetical protein
MMARQAVKTFDGLLGEAFMKGCILRIVLCVKGRLYKLIRV